MGTKEASVGTGKAPLPEKLLMFRSEKPFETKPLTPGQIAEEVRVLGGMFDVHERRAEALRRG